MAIASLGFGAKIIEKHFTLDRELEGNDHKISLLPEEFKMLVEGVREVEASIGNINARTITQGEILNREVLGKSLVVNRAINKGEVIQSDMVDIRSPGQGIPPYRKKDIIGIKAKRNFKENDFIFDSDLQDSESFMPKEYSFKRKWGIPVRFHDIDKLNIYY